MKVLIAGIGNVFLGDDAFGVEVAHRLRGVELPGETTVKDVGVRGIHLAYELLDPVDLLVLVDLAPRGGEAGTLYVIDPEADEVPLATTDAHGMSLEAVLATVQTLGGSLPKVRIVGCEPLDVEPRMGLSDPVAGAVEPAVTLVRDLLEQEIRSCTTRTTAACPASPSSS